jgi:hypothetical protein
MVEPACMDLNILLVHYSMAVISGSLCHGLLLSYVGVQRFSRTVNVRLIRGPYKDTLKDDYEV